MGYFYFFSIRFWEYCLKCNCSSQYDHEEKVKKLTEENTKQEERIYEIEMELAEVNFHVNLFYISIGEAF